MSKVTSISKEYFEINPTKVAVKIQDLEIPTQEKVHAPLDENLSQRNQSDLIRRVFENKTKSLIKKRELATFDDGGAVNADQEVWTPYEFLHELLPDVYGGRYIVSDKEGEKLQAEVVEKEKAIELLSANLIAEYQVTSVFDLPLDVYQQISDAEKALESFKKFVTESELQAFVFANPKLNADDYIKEKKFNKKYFIDNGLVMCSLNPKYKDDKGKMIAEWFYKYEYLTGDLYKKKTNLEQYKPEYLEYLTEAQWQRQLDEVVNAMPQRAKIEKGSQNSIFINPTSFFATDEANFTVYENDFTNYDADWNEEGLSLKKAFVDWLRNSDDVVNARDLKKVERKDYIWDIYVEGTDPKKLSYITLSEDASKEQRQIIKAQKDAQSDGERMMNKFLSEGLNADCRVRLELLWNAKYNNLAEPKYYKIPVALTLAKQFKDNSDFIPNETQIQSVQFMKLAGSGLLAYGVGVGKTASSILNVSYAVSNNLCKNPLFVVPLPTYEKWIGEMQGYTAEYHEVKYIDDDGRVKTETFEKKSPATSFRRSLGLPTSAQTHVVKRMKGLLPHLPEIVGLGNLNQEMIHSIKDYTDDDIDTMDALDDLLELIYEVEDADPDAQNQVADDNGLFPSDWNFIREIQNNSKISGALRQWLPEFSRTEFIESLQYYRGRFVDHKNPITGEIEQERVAPKKERQKSAKEYFLGDAPKQQRVRAGKTMWVGTPYVGINFLVTEKIYALGTMKEFPAKTIFVCTYEGLAKLGCESLESFNEERLNDNESPFGIIYNELSQGEFVEGLDEDSGSNLYRGVRQEMFGDVRKPKIYMKELGVDYMVFDESHFFKKSFVGTRGKPKYNEDGTEFIDRERAKYKEIGKDGVPTPRSLNAYINIRYVQIFNKGGNICHLTATPFTNQPIEIYSMLALTNIQFLKDIGFKYIEDFYDMFMNIRWETRVKGAHIVQEQILAGYNNAPQMRNIIFAVMDYKNGEDANIKRPNKLVLPSVTDGVYTTVQPTTDQEELMQDIKSFMRGNTSYRTIAGEDLDSAVAGSVDGFSDKELMDIIIDQSKRQAEVEKYEKLLEDSPTFQDDSERGKAEKIVERIWEEVAKQGWGMDEAEEDDKSLLRTALGMGMLRQVTLSPYLFVGRKKGGLEPTYREYIESSPKLLYTINCIVSQHRWEEENGFRQSGSVIYMNMGVTPSYKMATDRTDAFGNIIYEDRVWNSGGFEKIKQYLIGVHGYSEEQVVVVHGKVSNTEKEKRKNAFLSGKALVLIGSSTISTGVDLQNNASSLFMCSFDWNPTDNEQVNGRIHRQGNRFLNVRLVYPMIENSIDPIIFQLLQEKTQRIRETFDRKGKTSALDLRDFDPAQLKKMLITDPADRTAYWVEEQQEQLEDELIGVESKLDLLRRTSNDMANLEALREPLKATLTVIDDYKKQKKQKESIEGLEEKREEFIDKFWEDVDKQEEELKAEAKEKGEEYVAPEWEAKLSSELRKYKKNQYDHENDPDGRYVPTDISDVDDAELQRLMIRDIGTRNSSQSWYYKNDDWNTRSELNNLVENKYPAYRKGEWLSDEQIDVIQSEIDTIEAEWREVDAQKDELENQKSEIMNRKYMADDEAEKERLENEAKAIQDKMDVLQYQMDGLADMQKPLKRKIEYGRGTRIIFENIIETTRKWLDAKRLTDKNLKTLGDLQIDADTILSAQSQLNKRVQEVKDELKSIEAKAPEMLILFQKEYEANKQIAPTVDERVDEFAKDNARLLGEEGWLYQFKEDLTPVAEDMPERDDIEPEYEETEGEDAQFEKLEAEAEYIENLLEDLELLLEDAEDDEDEEEIEYLTALIEDYQMLLEDTYDEMDELVEEV
jgi:hypothetical protein